MRNYGFRDRLDDPIHGDRLVLRAPVMGDMERLATLANDRDVHKWLARLPHPYGEKDAREFISGIARSDGEHAYAIELPGEGLIGTIGLHLRDGLPEIGYWLGQPYWGKGYMTEAVTILIRASAKAGAKRIRSRIKAANRASRNVLEKAGFSYLDTRKGVIEPDKGILMSYFVWEENQ